MPPVEPAFSQDNALLIGADASIPRPQRPQTLREFAAQGNVRVAAFLAVLATPIVLIRDAGAELSAGAALLTLFAAAGRSGIRWQWRRIHRS
jgi:hypothetical protein